ncbi:MAG: TonB family protein [Terracidiphilus sp.]
MRYSPFVLIVLASSATAMLAQQTSPASAVAYKPAEQTSTVPAPTCPPTFEFHPEVDGIYNVGGDIKAPKLKHYVPAQWSNEAKTRGAFNPFKPEPSAVSFVVDTQGLPQDVCILKPAGYGLDAEAAKAVWQYRFQPATKSDGTAVAVRVSIHVAFNAQP